MSNHANFTAAHRPFADVYADATARLAATGFPRGEDDAIIAFAPEDLYKTALQLSNGTEWILTDDSPITWVQLSSSGAVTGTPFELVIACSDESTALTTGTAKVTFRMPRGVSLTAVRASLTVAQASGSIFTVDINEAGTTILSTKLTIDNTEKTSTTAATPPVISDASLADDAEMTIDIDQIGNGSAKGLKVTLIGTRT
jgi:hypothetical protein